MQITGFARNKYLLLIAMLLILLVTRIALVGYDLEESFVPLIVAAPFVYWWITPYLLAQDIEMPSWGFTLKADSNKLSRLALFVLGISIYLACIIY
jgi:hypothetical protein